MAKLTDRTVHFHMGTCADDLAAIVAHRLVADPEATQSSVLRALVREEAKRVREAKERAQKEVERGH